MSRPGGERGSWLEGVLGGHFRRLEDNPVVWPGMPGLRGRAGRNINGPSLVRVPDWVEDPLGKFYLYFGHHRGKYVRLAYSEHIEGPYEVFKPGTLHRRDTPARKSHVASPDVHLFPDRGEVWMWYHGGFRGTGAFADQGQVTFLATSRDGIHFTSGQEVLAPFYLRVFRHGGYFYGIAKNDNKDGMLLRSPDGHTPFERGPTFVEGMRHVAVRVVENTLWLFFTRVGDAPEVILLSTVDLGPDWRRWRPSPPAVVLEPEMDWEGAGLPVVPSRHGPTGPTRALRDPALFVDGGDMYLLYCVKGEQGIALTKLEKN
ncbi:MAG: hypothetical protein ACTSU5_08650 [Promethearchaeota archaeon]